jgi:hypothetical protein
MTKKMRRLKKTLTRIEKSFLFLLPLLRKLVPGYKKLPLVAQKTLAIILCWTTLITGSGALYLFGPWHQKASASWFDDSWAYRKAIDVTVASSASDITNLQMLLTVDTSTGSNGISSGQMQGSCQDLRFTSVQGKLLPYYIDSGCTTTTTKIWVLVDLIPKNTTKMTLYMYYGNPSAPQGSDPTKFDNVVGLQGYWTMNEPSGSTAADSSITGNDGSASGTTVAAGQYSNSRTFNGSSDYVSASDHNNLDLTSQMTLEAWVKYTSTSGYGFIISKTQDGGGASGYELFRQTGSGSIRFSACDAVGSCSGGYFDITTSAQYNDGNWHHVVGTAKNGDYARIYVDGLQAAISSSTVSQNAIATSTALNIGRRGNNAHFFNGSIDDVKVYSTQRSADQVAKDYTNTSCGGLSCTIATTAVTTSRPTTSIPTAANAEKAPSPIAYWKFDEGTGTTAKDSTSSALTGTISGASWQTEDLCVSNKCLNFDGTDDYVDIGSPSSLNFNQQDFTIESWFLTRQSSDGNIFSKSNEAGGTRHYYFGVSSNGFMSVEARDNGASGGNVVCTITGTTDLRDNKWHHAVLSFDDTGSGTTCTLYVDGRQIGTNSTAFRIASDASQPYIGRIADGQYFKGKIDQLKVYNYALSSSQALANYNARANDQSGAVLGAYNQKALSDGLVGYWKMDESSWTNNCSTASVLDSSGNGFNATSCPNTTGSTTPVAGKFGNAGSFDGSDDYVLKAPSGAMAMANNITVSMWVKPGGQLNEANGFWSYGHDTARYIDWFGHDGSGRLQIKEAGGTLEGTLTGTTILTTTNWYFVTATISQDQIKIYLNGNLEASGDLMDGTFSAFNFMNIGTGENEGLTAFNGKIDEVRLYNRILSASEINQLYNFAPGPSGYWKLDESSGTSVYDSSGNALTGTATGTTPGSNGKYGKARTFTADSTNNYVTFGDPTALQITGSAVTLEAWIKTTDTNSAAEGIVTKWETSESGKAAYALMADEYSSGQPRFYIFTSASTALTATTAVNDGRWHHLTGVYDGSNMLLYIDGVLNNSTAKTGNIASTSRSAMLGTLSSAVGGSQANEGFPGNMDEVKIYNYARTQKQVIEDMNASHPAGGSPVGSQVAYWKMDEGYGTTANDSGPNANSLTLSTASWSNAGKFLKAFDGGDNKRLSRSTDSDLEFSATDDLSVSIWYKSDAASNPAARQYLLSDGPGSAAGYAVWANTDGTVCFGIDDDATADPPEVASCTTTDLYDATWHHLVGVRNVTDDKTYLYVDAALKDSDSDTTTATLDSSPTFYLGDENGSDGSDEFLGDIDEVKIYRSALTSAEVALDYNRGASQVLGTLSDTNSLNTSQPQSATSEYCVPGDTSSSSCAAPVGRWDFEEGSGTSAYDSSGNGNVGSFPNGVPNRVKGKVGKALDFNSSSTHYASLGTSSTLRPSTTLTTEAWVKLKTSQGSFPQILAAGGATGSTGYSFHISNPSNQGIASLIVKETGFAWGDCDAIGTTNLRDNKWHYLQGVYNGTNNYIYVDGKLEGSDTCQNAAIDYGTPTGAWMSLMGDGQANELFNGVIDQVKIFNYARSSAQLAWDYNKGAPVAWWKFDECQGTTTYDSSGNGNVGLITPGAGSNTSAGTCTSGNSAHMWADGATGKFNSSLGFDGSDDYICSAPSGSCADDDDFDLTSALTVSAWVKYTSLDGSDTIVSKTNSDSTGYWLGQINSGTQSFRFAYNADFVHGTSTVQSNTWYHVVGVYDGSTAKLYVNGKLENTDSGVPAAITANAGQFKVGDGTSPPNTYGGPHQGQIDDVRVYNYPLTPLQVQQLYDGGSAIRYGPSTGSP